MYQGKRPPYMVQATLHLSIPTSILLFGKCGKSSVHAEEYLFKGRLFYKATIAAKTETLGPSKNQY
jgi:hypothetical protein